MAHFVCMVCSRVWQPDETDEDRSGHRTCPDCGTRLN